MKKSAFILVALLLSLVGGSFAQTVEDQQRSEFVPPIMIVNTSFLNIRTGPGAEYPILLTVVGGTELPVLGTAGDGVWYQVSTIEGNGWLNSEFAIARGDFRNVPRVDAPSLQDEINALVNGGGGGDAVAGSSAGVGDPFTSGRAWGLAVVESHPVRTRPTINASSLGSPTPGLERVYPIFAAAAGGGTFWYQTELPDLGRVWVEAPKIRLRPYACGAFTAVVFNKPVRPTVGPDGSGTLDGSLTIAPEEEAYLLDNAFGQYKIELFDGSTGWIRVEDAIVRDPIISAASCDTVSQTVAGDTGGDAMAGDMADGMEAPAETMLTSPLRVIINTGFLNIRSGPGSQFSVVETVPGGTTLDVTGFAPDGVWYRVRGAFGTGWVNSEFVIIRGNGEGLPVIRDAVGELARPVAMFTNAITLYSTPSTGSAQVAVLSGPLDVDVVARTADAGWVQVDTSAGFGWVLASQVIIAGDVSLAPVVGG